MEQILQSTDAIHTMLEDTTRGWPKLLTQPPNSTTAAGNRTWGASQAVLGHG